RFGRRRFTTVYAAVGGDVASLDRTASTLRRELHASRIRYDRKRFVPHLTLARPGDRLTALEIAEDLAALGGPSGPQWTLTKIALVESHLGPEPRHDVIHTSTLGRH